MMGAAHSIKTNETMKTLVKKTAVKKVAAKTAAKKGVVANKATPPVKATAKKASSTSSASKVKGVTEMTKEKHSFEGFAVRTQRNGYHFRQYVSSSLKNAAAKATPKQARSAAYDSAVALKVMLDSVLDDKKNWKAGSLTRAATAVLTGAGFKVEIKQSA